MPKIHIREIIATTFHILAIFFTLFALIPFCILTYWALDNRRPIENVTVQFSGWDADDPNYAILTWTADRYRVCPGKAVMWLFGDRARVLEGIELPPARAEDDVGKTGVQWTESVMIPNEARHTTMENIYLRIRMTWQCNPLHQWSPLVLDLPEIAIPVSGRPG